MTNERDAYLLNAALQRGLLSPAQAEAARVEAERVQGRVADVIRGPLFLGAEGAAALEAELRAAESGATLMDPPAPAPAPPPPPPPFPSTAAIPSAGTETVDLPPPSAAGRTTPPPASPQTTPRAGAAETFGPFEVLEPGQGEAAGALLPERLGPFEVLEKLGQGGMGAVYKARDPNLGRIVALKVLAPALRADKEAADRFLREARAAAAVNHPNVITVHAVAGPTEPEPYMALEFLPGGDAEALALRHGGRLPEALALGIMRDCARGLVAIERAGLLHRDLKPANIFVTAEGQAKLADLGLARNQAGDDRMTVTGTIVGTPAFMAPEQARAERDLDIRTDIYSLGASLFGLLAGKPPFVGSSAFVVVSNLLNKAPPKLGVIREDLHPQTLELIKRAMAKEREDRYPDAGSLLGAVEAALAALHQGGAQANPGPGYQGQPALGYPAQAPSSYQGQVPSGYQGQPPGGYQGHAPSSYQGHAPSGYQGQPSGYPGQAPGAHPGQPPSGYHPQRPPSPHMSTSDVVQKVLMLAGAVFLLLICCCVLLAAVRGGA